MVSGMRMSAYRMHSLVGVGGDDDYFSSDLPDTADGGPHVHPLSTSFGKLSAPALALWCEGDHCGNGDQRPLLRRWEAAAHGKLTWHVLEGASHMVSEPAPQADLNIQVVEFLSKIKSGEAQPGPTRA
jgi:pimeloyl-ACP methyl ester carboxylesterase